MILRCLCKFSILTVNIETQPLVASCNNAIEHESVDIYSVTICFNNTTRKLR